MIMLFGWDGDKEEKKDGVQTLKAKRKGVSPGGENP